MTLDDLRSDVRNAVVLLQLLDRIYPDRIDAEMVRLLQDLEQNDLALAALLKGAEFLKQLDNKPPRR